MKAKSVIKNPMAKDLRQPKYRPQVIPNKKKSHKTKHKLNLRRLSQGISIWYILRGSPLFFFHTHTERHKMTEKDIFKAYTKNPFQLRYDVLAMAKDMMDKAYETNMEVATKAMELYKEDTEQALKAWDNYVPKMYTPEEIKKNAEILYTFVTKKEDS